MNTPSGRHPHVPWVGWRLTAAIALLASLTAVAARASGTPLSCDDSLKKSFASDPLTTVVLVKAFKKGERLLLSEAATQWTQAAGNDICLVKLNVGPGNPGPASAPSTSRGIGIEVWLPAPANWNERIHVIGGGGWVGGWAGSPRAVAEPRAAAVAGDEGAVSSSTDAGHSGTLAGTPSSGGDFAMNPDGTINQVLWRDSSSRAIHEQAIKTKALAAAYYGRPAKYSYWDGASTGGRQALNLAQNHPEDFDGIIANMPAINWTRLATGGLYPQIVFQHDLGGVPLSEAQQDFVSTAAIRACDLVGGQHLGYIMDPASCRYDPTTDPDVLCKKDGGRNTTPTCISKIQANAFNKIWYGMTSDGSVPSPSVDNGWDKELDEVRRWYGLARGTSLYNAHYSRMFGVNAGMANVGGPWTITSDVVALELQNPTLAAPNFKNASGNGADLWKTLSYSQLSNAFDRGLALQPLFADIDTINPDLSAFKARGGKLLGWQGMNDEVIAVQGTIRYYRSVIEKMGGLASVQGFYKLYLVPGNGHGPYNGTANTAANPPVVAGMQFYQLLREWVEKDKAPDRIEIASSSTDNVTITQPLCPYPQKATYTGGNPRAAESFKCS